MAQRHTKSLADAVLCCDNMLEAPEQRARWSAFTFDADGEFGRPLAGVGQQADAAIVTFVRLLDGSMRAQPRRCQPL